MLTIVVAIVLVFLFFSVPVATVLGSIGFLLASAPGAVIGAGIGFFFDAAIWS